MTEIIIHNGVEYSDEEFDCPPLAVVRDRVQEQRAAILRACPTVETFRAGPHGGEEYEYEELGGTKFVVSHGPYTGSGKERTAAFNVVDQLWRASQASTVVPLDKWRERNALEVREIELNGKPMSPEEHRRAIQVDSWRRQKAGLPSFDQPAEIIFFPARSLDEFAKAHPEIDVRAVADRLRARAAEQRHELSSLPDEAAENSTDAQRESGHPPQLEPGESPGATLFADAKEIEERQRQRENDELDEHALKRDEAKPTTPVLTPSRRFRRITAANHALQLSGAWLVKGLLPAHGLNTIIGASGAGKTFLVLDLLLHIAMGWPWRGRRTKKCPVTYVAAEAGVLAQNRVIGWCRHHGVEWPENFHLIADNLNLFRSDADAMSLVADIKINQPGCGLVCLDTLARVMTGGNEREGQDMGKLIAHAEHIAAELGAGVYLVHHIGKVAAAGSRGASELPGAVNFEGTATRGKEPGAIGTLKVTKQRDGVTGIEIQYVLKEIELGRDEDGDMVTTAVAVEPGPLAGTGSQAGAGKEASTKKPREMGSNQKAAVKAFSQFVGERRTWNPGGMGFPAANTVLVADREEFTRFAAGKLDAAMSEKLKTMKRVIQGLVDSGFFVVNEGLLWQPSFTDGKP